MIELTRRASDPARVIAAATDTRAASGLPAPNAFETLVLNNPPKRDNNQKRKKVYN